MHFPYQGYLKNKILFRLIKFNVTFKNNYCFLGPSYEIPAYHKVTYISSYEIYCVGFMFRCIVYFILIFYVCCKI